MRRTPKFYTYQRRRSVLPRARESPRTARAWGPNERYKTILLFHSAARTRTFPVSSPTTEKKKKNPPKTKTYTLKIIYKALPLPFTAFVSPLNLPGGSVAGLPCKTGKEILASRAPPAAIQIQGPAAGRGPLLLPSLNARKNPPNVMSLRWVRAVCGWPPIACRGQTTFR